ncbi:hypothetical protein OH687_39320 (plasmid) [Burkholderia anthina]|nr:hypothetical protein OH687_39320 [Burkholderia anthina]
MYKNADLFNLLISRWSALRKRESENAGSYVPRAADVRTYFNLTVPR